MTGRLTMLLIAVALAGCGTRAQLAAKSVPLATLQQAIQPGVSSKTQILVAFGPSTTQTFDSGYEVWMYEYPAGAGARGEYVILFGPDGLVKKTRRKD